MPKKRNGENKPQALKTSRNSRSAFKSKSIPIADFVNNIRQRQSFPFDKMHARLFKKKIQLIEDTILLKIGDEIGEYLLSNYRDNFFMVVVHDVDLIQVIPNLSCNGIVKVFLKYFVHYPNFFLKHEKMKNILKHAIWVKQQNQTNGLKIVKNKLLLSVLKTTVGPDIRQDNIDKFVKEFEQYIERKKMLSEFYNPSVPTQAEATAFNRSYLKCNSITCEIDKSNLYILSLLMTTLKLDINHDTDNVKTKSIAKPKILVLHKESILFLVGIFKQHVSCHFTVDALTDAFTIDAFTRFANAATNSDKISVLKQLISHNTNLFAAATAADKTARRKYIHICASCVFVLSVENYFLGHRGLSISYEHFILRFLYESYHSLFDIIHKEEFDEPNFLTSNDQNVIVTDNVSSYPDKTNDSVTGPQMNDPGTTKNFSTNNPNGTITLKKIRFNSVDIVYRIGGVVLYRVTVQLRSRNHPYAIRNGINNITNVTDVADDDIIDLSYVYPIFNADGTISDNCGGKVSLSLYPYGKIFTTSNGIGKAIFQNPGVHIGHGNNAAVFLESTYHVAQHIFPSLTTNNVPITGTQVAHIMVSTAPKTEADALFALINSGFDVKVRSNDAVAVIVHTVQALCQRLNVSNPGNLGELLTASYSAANKSAIKIKRIDEEKLKYCEVTINNSMIAATHTRDVFPSPENVGGVGKSKTKQKGGGGFDEILKETAKEISKFLDTTTSKYIFIYQLLSSYLKIIFNELNDDILKFENEKEKELIKLLSNKYDEYYKDNLDLNLKSDILKFISNLNLNDNNKSISLLECFILPVNNDELIGYLSDLNIILRIYDKDAEVYKIVRTFFSEFNINILNVRLTMQNIELFSIEVMAKYAEKCKDEDEEEEDEEDEDDEDDEDEEDEAKFLSDHSEELKKIKIEYDKNIQENIKEIERTINIISEIVVSRYNANNAYKKKQETKAAATATVSKTTPLPLGNKKKQEDARLEMKRHVEKYFNKNPHIIPPLYNKNLPIIPPLSKKTGLSSYELTKMIEQNQTDAREYNNFVGPRILGIGGKRKTQRKKPKKTRKRFQKRSKRFQNRSRKA